MFRISALIMMTTIVTVSVTKAANGKAFIKKDDFSRNTIKAPSD